MLCLFAHGYNINQNLELYDGTGYEHVLFSHNIYINFTIMKIQLAILLFVFSTINIYAQVEQQILLDKGMQGAEFRLTGFVHTLDSGNIEFYAYQRDKNMKFVKSKFKRTNKTIALEDGWNKILFNGRIKKKSKTLTFGVWSVRTVNTFNIDDVSLRFKVNGQWESYLLENGDFESDSSGLVTGWMLREGYTNGIDQTTKISGVQSAHFTKEDFWKYGDFAAYGSKAKLNGVEIYYEVFGKGEPLLLLHGNNESISSFRAQIDEFRKYYKVIAVDSRGQGKSTINKQEMNYELMAKDMNALLEHLNIDSVHVVGWSDGGNTGLIMAMQYPDKVKTLSTMGANLFYKKGVLEKKFKRNHKLTIRLVQIIAFFNPKMWKTKVKVAKMTLKYPNINPQELVKIHIPVLVMAGENDVITYAHTKLIADSIKDSELLILKGAGHYAPQKKSKYFNEEVLAFIRKNIHQ